MFPTNVAPVARARSFPRIRGDVPAENNTSCFPRTFSPHTRGCSWRRCGIGGYQHVFPAYAGMFLSGCGAPVKYGSFPRIRGDVPSSCERETLTLKFSPHTRGCSPLHFSLKFGLGVFPAYAGMFLCSSPAKAPYYRFPRIRGDIPVNVPRQEQVAQFSPRARGCSASMVIVRAVAGVFPACAGMFL